MDNGLTYGQLGIALLVIFVVLIGVYIILTLYKLNKALSSLNTMLEKNKDNIDDALKNVPEICSNINSITKSLKGKTDALDGLFAHDEEAAAGLDIQSIVTGVSTIAEVIGEVKDYFGKKKKKRVFKRKIN